MRTSELSLNQYKHHRVKPTETSLVAVFCNAAGYVHRRLFPSERLSEVLALRILTPKNLFLQDPGNSGTNAPRIRGQMESLALLPSTLGISPGAAPRIQERKRHININLFGR